MSALSLRLPEELEHRLEEEAHCAGVARSEIARQAISDFLARRERERFLNELVAEACAGYGIKALRDEALALAEDALACDDETNTGRWWK